MVRQEDRPAYNGFDAKGSNRAESDPAKTNGRPAKPPKWTSDQLARIRERREQIYRREGVLSDSAAMIREDRDR
jgi:hypothetical protein